MYRGIFIAEDQFVLLFSGTGRSNNIKNSAKPAVFLGGGNFGNIFSVVTHNELAKKIVDRKKAIGEVTGNFPPKSPKDNLTGAGNIPVQQRN